MDSIPKELVIVICTFYYEVFQIMSSSICKEMTSKLQVCKNHIFKIPTKNPQDDEHYEGELYDYNGEFYYHVRGDGIKHGPYRIIGNEIHEGFKTYPKRHCLETGYYENGKLHDEFTQYYNNIYDNNRCLQPRIKFIYKNNEKDGLQLEYYADGTISKETCYINGKKDGYYKSYFLNGALWDECLYKDDMVVSGTYIRYNYDGGIRDTA